MMICSCRTTSMRSFVNGLAQVHKVEISSPRSSALYLSRVPRPAGRHQYFIATKYTRAFQTSSILAQEKADSGVDSETSTSANESSSRLPNDQVEDGAVAEKKSWNHSVDAHDLIDSLVDTPEDGNDNWRNEFFKKDPPKVRRFNPPTERQMGEGAPPRSETGRKNTWEKKDRVQYSSDTGRQKPWEKKDETSSPSKFKPKTDSQWPRRKFADSDSPQDDSARAPGANGKMEDWRMQKARLKEKFPEGWKPRKRLSPDALAGIRALNAQFPQLYTTEALAAKFEVSPEAIRRILRSKWTPDVEEEQERQERWHKRGMQIWETKAALGVKPPRKWRAEGIVRDPEYHVRRQQRIERNKEWEENEIRKYRAYRDGLQRAAGKIV